MKMLNVNEKELTVFNYGYVDGYNRCSVNVFDKYKAEISMHKEDSPEQGVGFSCHYKSVWPDGYEDWDEYTDGVVDVVVPTEEYIEQAIKIIHKCIEDCFEEE